MIFNGDRYEYIILAVYVDDLVIAGTTQEAIMKFKQQITTKFECKDLGELDRILIMEVTRTVEGRLSSTYLRRGPSLMALRLPCYHG